MTTPHAGTVSTDATGSTTEDPGDPASAKDSELAPTQVTSRLDGTMAVFEARYAFHAVRGAARNFVTLSLPDGGLVVAATATVDGVRHPLALEDAKPANDSFETMLASDAGADPTREILMQTTNGSIEVAVALPGPSELGLEVTVVAPTCLADAYRYSDVPEAWASRVITVKQDPCVGSGSHAAMVRFPTIEVTEARDRVSARAGRLVVHGTHVARLELGVAEELAEVPKDLATVFVIDASRSITTEQLETQRSVIRAYLDRVPTSRVQVIAVSRTARPMLPGWFVASSAIPRLERELTNLRLANGSNLDAGIVAAEHWLAQLPVATTSNGFSSHRIVVIHDGRLPTRLDETPPIAHELTHIVELATNAEKLGIVEDDSVSMAATGIATSGFTARAGGHPHLDIGELLHPVKLESLVIADTGWTPLQRTATACSEELEQGHSCVWWAKGSVSSPPVLVTGRLWNRKLERVVSLDQRQGLAIARELAVIPAGLDKPDFDPFVQAAIDRTARAVTTTTSLVTRWGGKAGYGEAQLISATSPDDLTSIGGHSFGSRVVDSVRMVHPMDLRPQLAPVVSLCKATDRRIEIKLETTNNEIVEVAVTLSPDDDAIRDCIVEAVWDVQLQVTDDVSHTKRHAVFEPTRR